MQKKLIKLKKQTPAGADLSEALPVSNPVPVGASYHKNGGEFIAPGTRPLKPSKGTPFIAARGYSIFGGVL
jgi:hypothetical protein